ncbi:hypothetical protein HWV62_28110 [Athelia sp. TMB]|nr:hypothetical protein HWV62_14004 [Athelia sp. TMB]KAF7982509.1 hypothetical protein HWV62_28110 [Athelia sp. TMB]
MKFNLAFTSPINPPHAYPPLSQTQVWNGLLRKCRRPQDFIDVMADCHILHEDANGMKRLMMFKPGTGPPSNRATEMLTYHPQTTVRIFAPSPYELILYAAFAKKIDILSVEAGNFMTNTISRGQGAHELFLTYTFDGEFLDIVEGTPQALNMGRQLTDELSRVVPETVEQIRAWARAGEL